MSDMLFQAFPHRSVLPYILQQYTHFPGSVMNRSRDPYSLCLRDRFEYHSVLPEFVQIHSEYIAGKSTEKHGGIASIPDIKGEMDS